MYQNGDSSQIDINFFEVLLDYSEIEVPAIKFTTKEDLVLLRSDNPDYFFYRDGEDVYVWPLKSGILPFTTASEAFKKVSFKDKGRIFSKILQIGLEKYLEGKGLKFVGKNHINADYIKVKSLVPDIPSVALYSKLTIQTQLLYFSGVQKLGFVINFSSFDEFTSNIQELIQKGVDPRWMVVRTKDGLTGKVVEVLKDKLKLDNGSDVKTADAIPLANKKNLVNYLSTIGKAEDFQNKLEMESKPDEVYKKIQNTFEFLKKNKDKIFLGDLLHINEMLNFAVSSNSKDINKSTIYRPTHYFKNNQSEIIRRTSDSLVQQGPFTDPPKQINILVISPQDYKGNVEVFSKKLSRVLINLFHFEKVNIVDHYFPLTDRVVDGYESVLYQDGFKATDYDIAIVIISEEHRELLPKDNPYYVLKSKLMNDRVPSQEIEIETIKTSIGATAEPYVLNNVALAIFGKIGCTPWAVEKIDPIRKEFIIGVGDSVIKNGDVVKNILGFATVFDFTGKYIVGECSTVATMDDYRETLRNYLKELISELIKNENIDRTKEIRFIFHLFKPAGKKNEIWAIQEALKDFSDYSIEYAILHLDREHNFRIFSNSGKELPQRGLLLDISDNKKLLCFVSSSLHKRTIRGNPAPLLVVLDNRSTFKDLDYLIKQVFYFSFLSCRSFIPSKTPITILYPSLLAKLSGVLKEIPEWDYKKLSTVKDKLWFV